jgi:hypothetical protein
MPTEEIDGVEADLGRLPAELQDLAPHVRRWATRDEEERDRRLEEAPTEELAAFWLAVSQRFPDINAYIEANAETPPPEATVLATTAECAFEAAEVINRRTGQPAPGA